MAVKGALNYILNMETTAWTAGAKKAGRDVDELDKKTKHFMEGLKGFKETGLGQAFEIAVGGGALRLIGELGHHLDEMVKKIQEVQKGIKDGTKGWGDMTEAVAGNLPVVGEFWQLGRNIRETFTHENEELERQKKLLDEITGEYTTIAALKKQAIAADLAAAGALTHDKQKLAEAKAAPGYERETVVANDEMENNIAGAKRDYEKNSHLDEIADTQKSLDTVKKKYTNGNGQFDQSGMSAEEGNKYVADQAKMKELQDEELRQRQIFEQRRAAIQEAGLIKISGIQDKYRDAQKKAAEKEAKEWQDKIDSAAKAVAEEAERFTEKHESPLEKFNRDMAEADKLLKAGAITQHAYDEAKAAGLAGLDKGKSNTYEDHHLAPLITHAGGVGLNTNARVVNPNAQTNALLEQLVKTLQATNKLSESQIHAIKNSGSQLTL